MHLRVINSIIVVGDFMSEFANNLRKYRKQKNMSQAELAKALNYGYTAIANYESGRNEPSFDCLIILAETLDITIDELLGVKPRTEEQQLLSSFKKLNDKKKKSVLELIHTLQS